MRDVRRVPASGAARLDRESSSKDQASSALTFFLIIQRFTASAAGCAARSMRYLRVVNNAPLERLALSDLRQAGLLR